QSAAHELVHYQNQLLLGDLLPALEAEGIALLEPEGWSEPVRAWAHAQFRKDIMPMLTPIGLDPAHPFPRVYNKSLNFIVALDGQDAFGRSASVAIVQAPRALPRVMKVPSNVAGIPHGFVLLSAVISAFVGELFPGLTIKGVYAWRVTRN